MADGATGAVRRTKLRAHASRPNRLRLPAVRRQRAALGGPVRLVRGVEHPGRDRRQPRRVGRRPVLATASAAAFAGRPPSRRSASVSSAEADRLPSGIGEVDRVLGGGLVPGSIVLFGGDPGIGKSTLLLQLAARLAAAGHATPVPDRRGVGVPGPRPRGAGRRRGRRRRPGGHHRPRDRGRRDRGVGAGAGRGRQRPDLGSARSWAARPAASARCARSPRGWRRWPRPGRTCVALVGHVTKEGTVAGPRTLEHLVDAVIYLEGERLGSTRLLRAAKNRFGSTDEVGVLEMRGDGLVEVADASRFFLESEQPPVGRQRHDDRPGGHAAAGGRDPGAGRPGRLRIAAPRHHGDRRQPGADADRGAGPPCRAEPHRPRRLRQRGGRPAHRGAGGGPGGGGGAGLQPARAPGARAERCSPASCRWRDGCGPPAVPSGAWPRRAAWASTASSPARRGARDGGGPAGLRDGRWTCAQRCFPRSPRADREPLPPVAAGAKVARRPRGGPRPSAFIGFITFHLPVASSIHHRTHRIMTQDHPARGSLARHAPRLRAGPADPDGQARRHRGSRTGLRS